jgi:hypothetical protein
MDYETIVIPKGTVLFRGFDDTSTLTSDFAGIPNGETFCIRPNFNVFFYPFPFVSGSVKIFRYITIYITTRDLKLVNLILPSKFNRQNRETGTGGVISCNKIEVGCGVEGRVFDPCIDYTKVSQDVTGMLAIAKADAETLRSARSIFQNWVNKYFTTYKDSRGLVGVPEFILHPRMDKTVRTEKITDFQPWYRANRNDFNYIYLHVMLADPKNMERLMDEFMSEDGLDLGDEEPYHLKLNKKTGFFQIDEFSNNQSELIPPNLAVKPGADMVLTQKKIYRMMSDKYPKADTIPGNLNHYQMGNERVGIGEGAYNWLLSFADSGKFFFMGTVTGYGKRGNVETLIYNINNKKYGFFLTPTGEDIKIKALATKDKKVTPYSIVIEHPMNYQISAYELKSDPVKYNVYTIINRNAPARDINGLLQYYAQKNGLLGASRRRALGRTLRRSRLLKSC